MIYDFERDVDSRVIYVTLELENKYALKMVLDTAASCTTIDVNALYMAGYSIDNKPETCTVETANGMMNVYLFEVKSLTALGRTINNMPVHVYDFLAHGIVSDYDGLLGLDFFENTVLSIDMKNNTIEVS